MPDWNKCAVDHANYVRNALFIERSVAGPIVLGRDGSPDCLAMAEVMELGVMAYFGCAGYRDNPAVREEVRLLRRLCAFKGIKELAFALDSRDRRSWTLIVHTEEGAETLAEILFVAHGLALSGKSGDATSGPLVVKYLQELEINVEELLKE